MMMTVVATVMLRVRRGNRSSKDKKGDRPKNPIP